jgi:ribosomal protein S18 acetylase RimI-like enzyme
MQIKILTPEDWQLWKDFRLAALKDAPQSFGASYEEEAAWSDARLQEALKISAIFAVFIDGVLCACAGFYRMNSLKTNHRGVLWGMYTKLEYRGQGCAHALMQTIIQHARKEVRQLHLSVVISNKEALQLYQKYGFKIYGTEPCALKIAEEFYDEHLLVLDLK